MAALIEIISNREKGSSVRAKLNALIAEQNATGWEEYQDGTYTSGSPFSIVADTPAILPNDAATVRGTQNPKDANGDTIALYSSGKITGRYGDWLNITIDFKAVPSNPATYIETWFDIGGEIPPLYRRISTFPKGNGVERSIVSTTGTFTYDTWEANGADVYVSADGPVDIYDVNFRIARLFAGRPES